MASRSLLSALLALAILPAGVEAAEIIVWADYDFRGDSTTFDGTESRLTGGWNDRISSYRVVSGEWEICRDYDFRNCQTVGPETATVARLGSGWNDVISSLRPIGGGLAASDPAVVAERLYRAVLGREADPEGLRNATTKVQAGQTTELVTGLVESAEFRANVQPKTPGEILDQIYRGLTGRPANAAARAEHLDRIEDGEVTAVVLDVIASDEFASATGEGAVAGSGQTIYEDDLRGRGRGTGVVVWGPRGGFERVSGAKLLLDANGRYRINFAGATPDTLTGEYTRAAGGTVVIDTVELDGRSLDADGEVLFQRDQFNKDRLARIDLTAGTPGTRDSMVATFVAEDYDQPREEASCEAAVRAQIEKSGGSGAELVFLAPGTAGIASGPRELSGLVAILSDREIAEYHCELDARRGQVVDATIAQR